MTYTSGLSKYLHFLLDYDGLIVDTEKLYFKTWCEVLTEEGQKICRRFHEGRHESEVYEKVKLYLKKSMSLEEVSRYRKSMFKKLMDQGNLEPMDGIKMLLEKLKQIAPLSIVSNSTSAVVKEGLISTGLAGYFQKYICVNSRLQLKPAPDLYLKAVSVLDVDTRSLLALEDSTTGILSAQAAGVSVVCINPKQIMQSVCLQYRVLYYKSPLDFLNYFSD